MFGRPSVRRQLEATRLARDLKREQLTAAEHERDEAQAALDAIREYTPWPEDQRWSLMDGLGNPVGPPQPLVWRQTGVDERGKPFAIYFGGALDVGFVLREPGDSATINVIAGKKPE